MRLSGLTRAGTPGSGYGGIYICSGLRRGTSEAETAACRKPGERKLAEGDRWLWPRQKVRASRRPGAPAKEDHLLSSLYVRDRTMAANSGQEVTILGSRSTGSFLLPAVPGLVRSWHAWLNSS